MTDRVAAIAGQARTARAMWRELLALSGPRTWWLPVGAGLAGALISGGSITVALVVGIAWLSLPFGLLRGGLEGLVRGDVAGDAVRFAIAVANLPLLVVLVLIGGASAGIAVAILIAIGIALVWPPLRLAGRPVADIAAESSIPVLAAVMGIPLGVSGTPWSVVIPWVGLAVGAALAVGITALVAADAIPPTGPTRLTGTGASIRPRGLAAVALAAIAVAAVLSATLGWIGLLAGIGIAVLALLPLMLVARSAAAPARAEAPALLALVGAWLVALLLHGRGVVAWAPWTVAVVVPGAVAGYTTVAVVATRIATWRHRLPRAKPGDPEGEVPSVTVVVAGRDAIASLPAALAAARSQTYADATTLAVDAGSTDASRDEAAAWLGADAVLDAGPPPDGWSSRDWAWHAGATASDRDFLLLVEDGTVLAPVAARILVEQAVARRLDLLSGVLRHAMPTVGERAGIPGLPLVLFALIPIWWSAISRGRPAVLAFAHDGFVLVRRSAYLMVRDGSTPQAGGAPDLARDLARTGARVGTIHAARLGTTRPQPAPDGAITAWRRTFLPMVGGRLAPALATLILALVGFVVPMLLPGAAILLRVDADLLLVACVPLVLLIGTRLAIIATQHHPLRTLLWHPVTVGLLVVGQVAAIADHIRGPRAPERSPEPPEPEPTGPTADSTAEPATDAWPQGQAGRRDPAGETMGLPDAVAPDTRPGPPRHPSKGSRPRRGHR